MGQTSILHSARKFGNQGLNPSSSWVSLSAKYASQQTSPRERLRLAIVTYWSELENHGWEGNWMAHPAARARINQRITGRSDQWPLQWLPSVIGGRAPFRHVLSVGSGVGNLERSLIELNLAVRVTGIDVSEEALALARKAAKSAAMSSVIEYVHTDAWDFLRRGQTFDAIFFHESLHHFNRLSEFLGLVRQALSRNGILYLDEYVGPARGEWGLGDLFRWNSIYWRLPRSVRRTRVIRKPINTEDPTEAIESSGILPAVKRHFRILERRDYGGNLLRPMGSDLDSVLPEPSDKSRSDPFDSRNLGSEL